MTSKKLVNVQLLRKPLFIILAAVQIALGFLILYLSIYPGEYPLSSAFLFEGYAIIQIVLGFMHVLLYLNRGTNFGIFTGTFTVLAFAWFVVTFLGVWHSIAVNIEPSVPWNPQCSGNPHMSNYCPEVTHYVNTVILEIFILLGLMLLGFVDSAVLFGMRVRSRA